MVLTADGNPIRRLPLFQSTSPKQCAICRKSAVFSVYFEVGRADIYGRRLAVQIEMIGRSGKRSAFPLSQAGDPRIDVSVKTVE